MNKDDAVFVAGHAGLVGSAIVRRLRLDQFTNLLLRHRSELDLTQQADVDAFFAATRPAYVFLAAAKVGGIHANDTYPADFIHENLRIQTNVIESAYRHGVRKLLFLGSSCIYPRLAPQPMREDYLLTGPLEPTNEWYAVAKIAGIKMCQAYWRQYGFRAICAMPTNLYGPGDNFNPQNSHVLPALMRKFHEARVTGHASVTVWGTGMPRREFLYVDDLADAALFLMRQYESDELINVGVGEDTPIVDLAQLVARVVGFEGQVRFDSSKPDGAPRKLLDVSKLCTLGWRAKIPLEDGIRQTYEWYLRNVGHLRA
jgi:GDP-L-fucose synthase